MRLRANTASRIDHEDRDVAVRCRHRHVAGVLLVTRRVGDEHATPVRQVHVPVRDVDRDALRALVLQAVQQQGVVDLPDGQQRRVAAAIGTCVLELVDRHRIGLGEQAADERGLAVVDRPAGDQVQHGNQGAGHQKYPSFFLPSMDSAPLSPSMRRPERSEYFAPDISRTRSSIVSAVDSTAPVSG